MLLRVCPLSDMDLEDSCVVPFDMDLEDSCGGAITPMTGFIGGTQCL